MRSCNKGKFVMVQLQAVAYFLDVTRMANPCYFHRLLDIIRSSLGKPLLLQLSRATDKLVSLLCTVPDKSNTQVGRCCLTV